MTPVRAAAVALATAIACGGLVPSAVAQVAVPKLSKPQRAVLSAVVDAVHRAAAGQAAVHDAAWQVHVLRASDGAHYVALHARTTAVAPPTTPVVLYVRLTSRRPGAAAPLVVERSAVDEWLRGERSDPRPPSAGGSMSVPRGEMPVGGTAMSVGDVAAESTAALRLLMLEHQRGVKRREAEDAARRAALENPSLARTSGLLPFEDFDVAALPAMRDGAFDLQRTVAVGPGDYDVHIGWTEWNGRGAPTPVHVISHRLHLPSAPPTFGLSDVIIADRVQPLAGPYPPDQQNAHPYTTGAFELSPATGGVLTVEGTLGLLVQVINPSAPPGGKPDVTVTFRIQRRRGDRDETVGALAPLRFDAPRLPVDFDVARGHPLLAATQAPLTTFARGRYRVLATAEDHLSGASATTSAEFEVAGTPASLLREAPVPGQPFRREAVLAPATLAAIVGALRPAMPSSALADALDAAAAGRFAELMRIEGLKPAERPVALALLGLGLYGLGDSPRAAAAQLSQAANLGAPAPPVLVLLGATSALGRDDKAAVTAWNQAREGGIADAAVAPLVIDAYLRQGDIARAAAMATAALDTSPDDLAARHALAATYLATRRHQEALRLLDAVPPATATAETRFLLTHALYAGVVLHDPDIDTPAGRERFDAAARACLADGGPHVGLVRDWMSVLPTARR